MTARPWSVAGAVCLAVACLRPAAPCAAQPPPDAPRRTVTDGVPGVSIFSPQRWGIIGEEIANPGDAPADVLSSHYFSGDPGLQFARRIWVPPHAKRSIWYPVLPPKNPTQGIHLHVQSLLLDRSRGTEVVLKERGGTVIHEGLLPSRPHNEPITGLIADPDDAQTGLMVQAARAALRLSPRLARLGGDALPPTVESLDGLDQLVVASDRPADDAAGARAIRQWLRGGGRLWVRLDRVSPDTVSLLLGEDFPCAVVGRVGLTRWRIEPGRADAGPDGEAADAPGGPAAGGGKAPAAAEGQIDTFEPPVEMVRVLAPGARPAHSVGGWPASFWRRAGRGLVLFTTLGPRAWVQPRPKGDKERPDPENPAAHLRESEPLRHLTAPFLKPREGPPLKAEAFVPLLAGEVGYRVVGRGTVLAVLGAFCLGLVAAGWWLGRWGDLSHLGWGGPAAALAAAVVLVAVGYLARSRVPPTAAVAQLVEVSPGAEDAPVTGLLGLYDPAEPPAPLGAERGGVFVPDLKGQAGGTRRMVWTDLERWHWENLSLAPGILHVVPFEATARLDEPVSARVTFGPGGAAGKVALGPFRDAADAILALPSRRHLAVRLEGAGGAFEAGPGDQLAPGQFIASDLLTDEQRRRQEVYRELLDRRTWPRYPERPTLLAWASPLDLGFTLMEGARRTGSALVAVPLEFDRPAPGTRVTIPAPFLPYRSVAREGFTLLYDPRLNDWVSSRARPAKTLLRFQVPAELLPLRVERAALEVDLNAQARPFEVFAAAGAEPLARRDSPVDRFRIELSRPELLQPDAAGGVYLGLSVGEAGALPGEGKPSSEWRINDLQLELAGRVAED